MQGGAVLQHADVYFSTCGDLFASKGSWKARIEHVKLQTVLTAVSHIKDAIANYLCMEFHCYNWLVCCLTQQVELYCEQAFIATVSSVSSYITDFFVQQLKTSAFETLKLTHRPAWTQFLRMNRERRKVIRIQSYRFLFFFRRQDNVCLPEDSPNSFLLHQLSVMFQASTWRPRQPSSEGTNVTDQTSSTPAALTPARLWDGSPINFSRVGDAPTAVPSLLLLLAGPTYVLAVAPAARTTINRTLVSTTS